jgi:exopolysaccharide biosynthesis polyprenyl glycosylphosphotransferase
LDNQTKAVQRGAQVALPTQRARGARSRDFVLRRVLALGDVIGLTVALSLAATYVGRGQPGQQILWGLVVLPAWIVLFKIYGLYDRDAKRVSHSTVDDLPWLFHALLTGSLALWIVLRFGPTAPLRFREGAAFLAFALVAIFVTRAGARALNRIITPPERVLLVGGGPMAALLARKFRLHPEYELEPIGYVDVAESRHDGLQLPYLGDPSEIEAVCAEHEVERVVILSPELASDQLAELIRGLRGTEIRIGILPHVVDVLGPSVEIDDVEGITVLGVSPPALTRSSRFLKRAMDITIASILLVLFLPLMIVAAVAVKATSSGSIFYSQERIGRGERRFRIYKFRTMVQDADARSDELKARSAHPVWLLLDHDPRITRVGRVLRHLSLDELPQLFNVVKGDMSLVGPRPMPPDVDEQIFGWGRRRLDLTPGLTGLWQVLGRTEIPFEEMVKLDWLYVTNWSLWQDVRLLIHTLPAVVGRRGVN